MVIAPSATAFDDGGGDATEIRRDRSLVLAHRGGDSAAFTAIVHAHHAGLLRQARRQLGDACDAEDAVQETLLRAYRGLGRFGTSGDWRLGAWLSRIMTNVCIDQRTRRQASTTLAARMHHEERAGADAGELASDPVALAAVREAMAQLPSSQRRAFVLRAVDDLSYRAIAEQLGISEENARARVQRARTALRRTLERTAALGAVPAAAWSAMRSSSWARRHSSWRAPRSPAGRSSLRWLVARGHLRDVASSLGGSGRGAAVTSTATASSSGALPVSSGAASGAPNVASAASGAVSAASSGVPGVPGASGALSVAPGVLPATSGAASGAANVAPTAAGAMSAASSPLSSATQLVNQLAGQLNASPAGQVLLASASGGAGGGRGALVLGLAASMATAGALSLPASSPPAPRVARFHPALVQGAGSAAGAPGTSGTTTSDSATAPVGGTGGGSSPAASSPGTTSASSAGAGTGSGTPSGSTAAASGGPSAGATTLPGWVTTALELAGGSLRATGATSSSSSGPGGSISSGPGTSGPGGSAVAGSGWSASGSGSGSSGSGSGSGGSGSGSSTSSAAVLPPGTCSGVAGFPGAMSQSPPKIVDGTVDQMLDTGRVDLSSAGFDPFFTAAAPLTGGGSGSSSPGTSTAGGGSGTGTSGSEGTSSGASSGTASGSGTSGGDRTSSSSGSGTSGGDGTSSSSGSGDASTTGSAGTTSGTTSTSPGDGPLLQMAVGTCLATSGSVLAVDLTGPGGLQVQLVGSLLSASALEHPASSGVADGPGAPASGSGAAGTGTSSSTSGASASSSTTGTTTGDGAPSATSGGSGSPGTSSAAATGKPGTASSPPATTSSGASSAGTTTSSPAPSGAVYLFAGFVHLYGTDAAGSSIPWGLPDWFVARLRVERSPSTAVLDVAFVGPTAETSSAAPNSTTGTATSLGTSPDATGS